MTVTRITLTGNGSRSRVAVDGKVLDDVVAVVAMQDVGDYPTLSLRRHNPDDPRATWIDHVPLDSISITAHTHDEGEQGEGEHPPGEEPF